MTDGINVPASKPWIVDVDSLNRNMCTVAQSARALEAAIISAAPYCSIETRDQLLSASLKHFNDLLLLRLKLPLPGADGGPR